MKIFTKGGCRDIHFPDFPPKHPARSFFSRITFFYLLLTAGCMHYALAGQGLDKIHVTLDLNNANLREVFKQLQEKSGLLFAYPSREVASYGGITLPKARRTVKATLDHALKGTPFEYHLVNRSVVISIKEQQRPEGDTLSILDEGRPDQEVVTGTVTDQAGHSLPGVNVLIKGAASGAVTDIDGNFRINASAEDILIFSFIGFTTVEEPLNGRTSVSIQLTEDISQLEAVEINAGYYTVKDEVKTGNIARITRKEIEKQPVSNPLQAMQGRMAGVYIAQHTGVPGGGFTVQVRGRNSIQNGNDPLYIVDGVPVPSTSLSSPNAGGAIIPFGSPLNSINPADIASIEVLKDADATAIYGSRGANGVVLITTRKGTSGKTKVDISMYQGVAQVGNRMDLLNSAQYLEMRREALANDEVTPSTAFPGYAPDLLSWDTTRYTDWQDVLIGGTALLTNGRISLSGGNKNTQFLIGGGVYRETTVFPGSFSDTKLSGHFNLNHSSLNKKFQASLTSTYVHDLNNLPLGDLTISAISLSPVAPPLYDESGDLNWENSTWFNPLSLTKRTYKGRTDHLIVNSVFDYELYEGLHLKTNLGLNLIQLNEISTTPIKYYNPAFASLVSGQSVFANNSVRSWIAEPQLNYSKTIGRGKLTLLVGSSFLNTVGQGQAIMGSGYTTDALVENLNAAPTVMVMSAHNTHYRYHGVFARINYALQDKYLINLTGRRDGSSRFGPGRRFANFGAVGMAWVFSEEHFIKENLAFLSFGKVRVSFGNSGNDQIGDYQYLDTYSATTYPYQGQSGLVPTRLANPDFGWESNQKLEGGIEIGLLERRIMLTISSYRNRSSNQLVGEALPLMTGRSSIQNNLPATVENRGWEYELITTNVKNAHFTWVSSLNLTLLRNELISFPNIESSGYVNRFEVGYPLSINKGAKNTGVDTETGLYIFEDIDGDGVAGSFPGDWQVLADLGVDYHGGFHNSFVFQGFQLDFLIQAVNQKGEGYRQNFAQPGIFGENQPVQVMDRWQQVGDISETQKFTQNYSPEYQKGRESSLDIVDASFIRLKNVFFSWTVPHDLSTRMNLAMARVFLMGQNLYTLTNYPGMDPENTNSIVVPPLRTFTAGIQLTF